MDAAYKEAILALAAVATGLVSLIAWLLRKGKGTNGNDLLIRRMEKLEELVHEVIKEQTAQGKDIAALKERTNHHRS